MKLNWMKLAAWQKGAVVGVILALIISVINVGVVVGFGFMSSSFLMTMLVFAVTGAVIGVIVDKK